MKAQQQLDSLDAVSPIDATDPTALLEWLRSRFGAKEFSLGDAHCGFKDANIPLDFIMTAELLRQAAERNLATRKKQDGHLSYTFKAQIHG